MLTSQNVIPQGVIDEGRLFALGSFSSANLNHARVVDVLQGLKDQVFQPFAMPVQQCDEVGLLVGLQRLNRY